MAARYGADFAAGTTPLAYHQPLDIGDARVTLVPAGHVLGSAQVVIDRGDRRVVSPAITSANQTPPARRLSCALRCLHHRGDFCPACVQPP